MTKQKRTILHYTKKIASKPVVLAILFLIAVTGGFVSFQKYADAQNSGQGLTVSPPSQEVSIDPGGTTTIKAKLRNAGNNILPITVHIEDFTAQGDEGQVQLTTDSKYSVASWTTVSPSSFTLAPGETREVTATINAPADAAGGRFGSFVFAVQDSSKEDTTDASVSQEIASLFLVKVNGSVDEQMDLVGFTAPAYSEFGPISFDMNFQNTGNVYVKAYGIVNVTDMFGRKVADIVVPGTNVFPGSNRVVKATLDKKFLIGNYNATALMYYGSETTQSLSATTRFFVFPTRIVVGIVVILITLFLMRKRIKKAMKALGGK